MMRVLKWSGGLVALFLLLGWIGLVFPIELAFYMAAGWILFLARSVSSVMLDWPSILLSLAALTFFSVGMHYFLGWLYANVNREGDSGPPATWKSRWTVATVGVVMLLFVAGIGAVGIVHQVVWMAQSPEPMIVGGSMREASRRNDSLAHTRDQGIGISNYSEETNELPPGGLADPKGRLLHGWQTLLLPFIDEKALYEKINIDQAWNHPSNAEALRTHVQSYANDWQWREGTPAEDADGYSLSNYASNVHVIGGTRALRFDEITDGKSTTIVTGEAFSNRKPWGYPANWRDPSDGINKSPHGFGAPWSSGGAQFSFADGHAKFIGEDIDPRVLRALATPNGGETIDANDF